MQFISSKPVISISKISIYNLITFPGGRYSSICSFGILKLLEKKICVCVCVCVFGIFTEYLIYMYFVKSQLNYQKAVLGIHS